MGNAAGPLFTLNPLEPLIELCLGELDGCGLNDLPHIGSVSVVCTYGRAIAHIASMAQVVPATSPSTKK
jgi:hypothetical protein